MLNDIFLQKEEYFRKGKGGLHEAEISEKLQRE